MTFKGFKFGMLLQFATIIFLSLINLIGSFTNIFLPSNVIQILNIIIGFLLMALLK